MRWMLVFIGLSCADHALIKSLPKGLNNLIYCQVPSRKSHLGKLNSIYSMLWFFCMFCKFAFDISKNCLLGLNSSIKEITRWQTLLNKALGVELDSWKRLYPILNGTLQSNFSLESRWKIDLSLGWVESSLFLI